MQHHSQQLKATGTSMNKLMPELSSANELTDAPSTRGVETLANFARTRAITAKLTLVFKSLRLSGHK
ncbi:MAG: hypothetical protein FF85_05515 [alpha proteobacterium QL1]|nr:MAG: hypothetical protein FF85_05515 [alpha proteobacterium QL1]